MSGANRDRGGALVVDAPRDGDIPSDAPVIQLRPVTIGGSSAAAACGIDPYRSRLMLWAEMTGRVEREATEAMRWGTLLEPVIVDALRDEWEIHYPIVASVPTHELPAWFGGTPDGLAFDANGPALLEVKTASVWAGHDWNAGHVPTHYAAQVQHYLHLTGLDRALLACLVGGQRLVTCTLERDEAAIALLLELEAEFVEHVVSDSPPAVDGSESSRDALAAMFTPDGGTVRLTRDQLELVRELQARKAQASAVKEQIAELENRLKLVMGDAETAIDRHDKAVLRWTATKRTALDVAMFKAERPELASLFTTTTETRRFTVV